MKISISQQTDGNSADIFWIGAAVAGALSAAVIFTAASAVYRKNRFDLKIGEEKVGSKEYQLCMDLVKYDVKMEIQKRYDALYGEDFWEQSYEDNMDMRF